MNNTKSGVLSSVILILTLICVIFYYQKKISGLSKLRDVEIAKTSFLLSHIDQSIAPFDKVVATGDSVTFYKRNIKIGTSIIK